MARLFDAHPTVMARIPLRPVTAAPETGAGLLDEGVFLASRSASRASAAARRGQVTLRAYDIRSRTRTTPHAVFCGVAVASLTPGPERLLLGEAHQAVTRPHPRWLAALADRFLDDEHVLPGLLLTSNNLVRAGGERLEAEHPSPDGPAHLGAVNATPVTRWVLETCRTTAAAEGVVAGLLERFPGAGEARARAAVVQMIRTGMILTDLLPQAAAPEPLAHLISRLPPQTPLRPALEDLQHLLSQADALPPGAAARLELLRFAQERADAILPVEAAPLSVDTLADATLTLPAVLGEQAARAASTLWRIGHCAPPLSSYHDRFAEAFGRHRMVPLLEAIDPVRGIGLPHPDDAVGARSDIDPRRSRILARLLMETTIDGGDDLLLTDSMVDDLAHDGAGPPPRTAEIHLRLLRRPDGVLGLAVCPNTGSQDAGSAAGRFAALLPGLRPHEPDRDGGPMIAEIVCRSRTAATTALAVETGFAPYRIPLGVPPRKGDLPPEDLHLVAAGGRLLVWSLRHNRQVTPVLYSRLAPDLLPDAARVLQLCGHTGTRPWHTWSWGPAGFAPFTPRVRYRDVLLAPARWSVPDALRHTAGNEHRFAAAVRAWRNAGKPPPPDVVVIEESDRPLPLDLRSELDTELLRRAIRRGVQAVNEPLGAGSDESVLPDRSGATHLLDLVVSLSRRLQPPPVRLDPRCAPRPQGAGRFLPGHGPWLSAAVAVQPRHQDAALTRLAETLDAQPESRRWFWLRYHSPSLGPHLRIRLHQADTANPAPPPAFTAWTAYLTEHHLSTSVTFEPYIQEVERYGGADAITAAEDVFIADSALTLAALPLHDDERLLLAATSAVHIVRVLADGSATALCPGPLPREDRRHREALRPRLRHASRDGTAVTAALAPAWAAWEETLTRYRDHLTDLQVRTGCASDVIHMHCNRLLGTQPSHERIARSLASDLLHTP